MATEHRENAGSDATAVSPRGPLLLLTQQFTLPLADGELKAEQPKASKVVSGLSVI